jgi:soluble lytic murein transglycosylase-like protein
VKGARYIPLFVDLESEFGTPAQYLYALAGRESRWNPRKVATIKGEATPAEVRGHAVGLFQLTRKVVTGYNEKHGTNYRKRDMLDAQLNARVAAWYLASPQLTRFATDWKDAREVAVVTQAWNSGPGASWRVLDTLRTRGVDRPTVDEIKAVAQQVVKRGVEFAGLQSRLYRYLAKRKTKWAKGVARATLQAFADPNFTEPVQASRVVAGLGRLFPWRWPRCLHR